MPNVNSSQRLMPLCLERDLHLHPPAWQSRTLSLCYGRRKSFHHKHTSNHDSLVPQCVIELFFNSNNLFYVVWRTGTKPIVTPHDSRRYFCLSGNRTYKHPHTSPVLYCACQINIIFLKLETCL